MNVSRRRDCRPVELNVARTEDLPVDELRGFLAEVEAAHVGVAVAVVRLVVVGAYPSADERHVVVVVVAVAAAAVVVGGVGGRGGAGTGCTGGCTWS